MNSKKKPFDDPRVRRALHLAIDRHVLVDVVKDIAPMQVGGFVYPFSECRTPKAELEKRLGYQEDPTAAIKEAKKLMAAAGLRQRLKNLDFVVRDVASFKLWAEAIQAMLKEGLNIETQPAHGGADRQWFEDGRLRQLRSRDRRDRLDAAGPVRLLQRLVRQGRAAELLAAGTTRSSTRSRSRSSARWTTNKRKAMIRKAEEILEQDPPLCRWPGSRSTTSGTTTCSGQNPTKFFGIYDVVRWDTVWMAQS